MDPRSPRLRSIRHGEVVNGPLVISRESRDHPDGRPWVYANMVTTIDGAATVNGTSGDLGGTADRELFAALRSEADVIVVGAQTVRAERYRLPRPPDPAAATSRAHRGQAPMPRLCIVTRQLDPLDVPSFVDDLPETPTEPWQRPLVATTTAGAGRFAHDPRWDAISLGDDEVDLGDLVRHLGERGLRRILCEGGPTLLAQFGASDLIDEWNFTITPVVVSGDAVRPVHAATPADVWLEIDRLLIADDSTMFVRYLTRRGPAGRAG